MKLLAKIHDVNFGIGGYQDREIGLNLFFKNKENEFEYSEAFRHTGIDLNYTKWGNPGDREERYSNIVKNISELLLKLRISDIKDLVGYPVELTIEGSDIVRSWRILDEVI